MACAGRVSECKLSLCIWPHCESNNLYKRGFGEPNYPVPSLIAGVRIEDWVIDIIPANHAAMEWPIIMSWYKPVNNSDVIPDDTDWYD